MRSVWNGVLRFGRVAVPVALVPARRDGRIDFRTIHRPCGNPVEQTTVCPLCGDALQEDLVKGWEVAPGEYVLVEDADLDALVPEAGRDLETIAYVDAAAIAPAYVDRTYYLRPASNLAGKRAYAIVAGALGTTGTAMIVRYVARKRENLALVRAIDGDALLGLQTLALAEDVLSPDPIHEGLVEITVGEDELELAQQIVERYVGAFDPAVLVSTQRQRVKELLEGKLAAEEITVAAAAAPEGVQPIAGAGDLEAALRASLKDAPKPRRRRQPAAATA